MTKKVFFILLFAISAPSAFAQLYSNQRTQWLKKGESIGDSLTIIPSSVRFATGGNDSLSYKINSGENKLTVQPWPEGTDSIFVTYKVFPMAIHGKRFRRNLALYDSSRGYSDGLIMAPKKETREEIFATQGINKTGNITRGISFGNNQDVFVNSSLNLQLEGKITPDIKLTAAITDQNVPLQPEGNTQNLQQFDRVYTQFEHKYGKLIAGDIILKDKPSYFMKYSRNVQGLLLETNYELLKDAPSKTYGGISFSKGKFASQFLDVTEGVQGPYRLRGPNNEQFIIILANSEKVFIDGKQLSRGFDRDYTIDYNQALIKFNNNVVITKFSRIRVDFEFNDRNYSRVTMLAGHYQQYKNFEGFVNFYSERDDPNAPVNISLSDEAKQQLALIGDSTQNAVTSGATSVTGFLSTQILYRNIDSLVQGLIYSNVLVYAPKGDSSSIYYTASFSDRGQGNGNYTQVSSGLSNGQVFKWVAPVNGIKQGRYEPIKSVPLPTQKQLINVGGSYKLEKYGSVYAEVAFSKNDVNLFSPPAGRAVDGWAIKGGYKTEGINLSFLKGYKAIGSIDYEFDNKNFSPIDRFRYVEFDRDWSGTVSTNQFYIKGTDDNIFNATLGVMKDPNNTISYTISRRLRGADINGIQHKIKLNKGFGKIQTLSDLFYLNNQRVTSNSDWVRFSVNTFYNFPVIVPGYTFSLDKNIVKSAAKDSITFTAMNYEQHTLYVRSADTSSDTRFKIDYNYRTENAPVNGEIKRSNLGQTLNFSGSRKFSKTQDLSLLFTYRNLENYFFVPTSASNPNNLTNQNTAATFNPRDETIMGRLDWNSDYFNRVIRSEFTYSASSGRELKRQFQYVKVPSGQGNFTWRDDNGDGVEQLNEFYTAINFDEKNYIRYFIPTDQFVRVFQNTFNYRLNITPPTGWRTEGGFKSVISRFSNVSSWRIDRRVTDDNIASRFWPFQNNINIQNILSTEQVIRSNLFFNRTNPTFGIELGFVNSDQKSLLVNGFSGKNVREWQLNTRVNFLTVLNGKIGLLTANRGTSSDFLINQNYLIRIYQVKPELAWQPIDVFRLTGTYTYDNKRNIFEGGSGESALFQTFQADAKFNKVSTRTIQANIKYINIAYNGIINSPIGYEMLEALQPGNNFTWAINIQQKLTNGLQITVNYEGRSSQGQKVVHIGRMQVSALF